MKTKKPIPEIRTEKDKATEMIAQLERLKRDPGWKLIVDVLVENIKQVESIILDSDDDMDKDELRKWRDRRYYQQKLMETPDFIINKIRGGIADTKNIELDPYNKE